MKKDRVSTERKAKRPHWYLICRDECVLCGSGSEWRERQYTPKPTDPNKRYHFSQRACQSHFI